MFRGPNFASYSGGAAKFQQDAFQIKQKDLFSQLEVLKTEMTTLLTSRGGELTTRRGLTPLSEIVGRIDQSLHAALAKMPQEEIVLVQDGKGSLWQIVSRDDIKGKLVEQPEEEEEEEEYDEEADYGWNTATELEADDQRKHAIKALQETLTQYHRQSLVKSDHS